MVGRRRVHRFAGRAPARRSSSIAAGAGRRRAGEPSDADYNFISNELFVAFTTKIRREHFHRFGILPASRAVVEKDMTVAGLEQALTGLPDVGAPDYSDEGMLQYLRTERIVPPYQTRGYKLVELVRIYEIGSERRS